MCRRRPSVSPEGSPIAPRLPLNCNNAMVYFDHNATTPIAPEVLEGMLPYLGRFFGNPSGLYRLGRLSQSAVESARESVARLVGAEGHQIFFTSGGTESNNQALIGLAHTLKAPSEILVGATEHPSVQAPLKRLSTQGFTLRTLKVSATGLHSLVDLDPKVPGTMQMAALMGANNETGVIQSTQALAAHLRASGGYLHVDAVQCAGKIPLDFRASGAHTLSMSAHKIGGPKGVGALVVEQGLWLDPLLLGGGQEKGGRAGTENVAAIVGFGIAARLSLETLQLRAEKTARLRERLEEGLGALPGVVIFAQAAARLPNTVQFAVPGFEGEALVMRLDQAGFAVSSGSACAMGANEPSPVLLAMGVDPLIARSAIRVSLGAGNTEEEIAAFLDVLRGLMAGAH